ncbi:hypothetical protein L1049_015973 [Liquidambar formosana]|uniref:Uncharacterized protein n=1 Tax=Liquidambar formosana TaxID=63359 RepID=A0AAP0S5I8_LIQFO
MEVVVPVPPQLPPPAIDFNFDSTCSSPYMTAPSSPQRFGNFFLSAPTSPTRVSSFYRQLNNLDRDISIHNRAASAIPFGWEEKPGIPKSSGASSVKDDDDDDDDFAFDFSGQLERASLSAEELFDGGKIKPLKPPPRLQFGGGGGGGEENDARTNSISSPKSPKSRISQGKKMFREALSSPKQRKDFDPFAAAIEETRRKGGKNETHQENSQRGRERLSGSSLSSKFVRKGTRSLSPLRVSDIAFEIEDDAQSTTSTATTTATATATGKASSSSNAVASFLNSISFSKGYRKWRLKDFLLFRSASEGRAATGGKDPLRKYAALSKKSEDVKNSSFRSTDSIGSVSSSRRRGTGVGSRVSLHGEPGGFGGDEEEDLFALQAGVVGVFGVPFYYCA